LTTLTTSASATSTSTSTAPTTPISFRELSIFLLRVNSCFTFAIPDTQGLRYASSFYRSSTTSLHCVDSDLPRWVYLRLSRTCSNATTHARGLRLNVHLPTLGGFDKGLW
jgi:hypothetical protein